MTKTIKAMLLAAPLALVSTSADAATYRFDLSGAFDASFTIDSDLLAPPVDSGSDYFLVTNIGGTFGGMADVASSIQFSTLAGNGGLTLELSGGDFLGFFGSQLFTGMTSMPSFTLGQYTLTADIDGAPALLDISEITASAVPEPASWAMMIAGMGGIGFTMRRRKPVVSVSVAVA
ncbi:PEP-CTERM sorting domain-containing protein [Sphingomonas aliaeris]|uniref:PEP-CTERM sorting domain-containing protein n=1 Tax=Sphingomonas aliaeris TaxID=2759526 RepID=A0A974NUA7_9SPHN|nr:PEPxxWA-CTERM sorting domain-containing protein [Sphingomonas aliaeris]QQV76957.1 PEP-CTERM sorting domain-containing protein [Sphingomonas aliaeris]